MRTIISMMVATAFILSTASAHLYAAEDTPKAGTAASAPVPEKKDGMGTQAAGTKAAAVEEVKISKEEIITSLNNILLNRTNINVNGVKVDKVEGGGVVTYNGKKLQDLDKDTLLVILRQVNQQVSMQNFENLQRQLRQMKQLDNLDRASKAARQQRTYNPPPAAPKVPKSTTR